MKQDRNRSNQHKARPLAAAVLLAFAATAAAQDSTQNPPPATSNNAKNLQAVIVTGTRTQNRTDSSSLSPIDVVPASALQSTGTNELATALARLIPSLNFPRPAATDTTDSQRPAQLRGLSPDEVLVLVDGKRWHTSALINTDGTIGRGSAPVDLNTIPLSAIDHIEVLRDGASAQYGSDAIAGVINIILKHGAQGGSVELDGGRYQRGGGQQWQGSANFGIPLNGDKGWLRISLDDGHQDPTNHGGVDVRYPQLGEKQVFGDPSISQHNVFLNAQYDISKNVQFYAYGSYHERDAISDELYRNPYGYPSAVSSLLTALYPDGYQPLLQSRSTDQALVAGVRGTTESGWRWDVSANYGGNRVSLDTIHSANYAFLNDFGYTPTSFFDGIVSSAQQAADVDIAKDFSVGWLPNPLTLAFGAEYLRETYSISAGDPSSYYVGTSGVSGGAQGFSGYSPVSTGAWSRSDIAQYVSLETNLTDKLGTSIAVRHEEYNDFGNTVSGALAARYDFTDRFALRASASTGFRAPSLAQEDYSQIGSLYLTPSSAGPGIAPGIYQTGLLPVSNPVAQLLGAQALRPEKSHNYTIGAVFNPIDPLTLTFDIYQIQIFNRIVLSSTLSGLNDPAVVNYLAANGITNVAYTSAQYFTNAVNTRTQGGDLVTSYHADFGNDGVLDSTLSYNYNRTLVYGIAPNPEQLQALGLELERVSYRDIHGLLANSTPRSKLIFNENYTLGRWVFNGNLTRYGSFTAYSNESYLLNQIYSPQWVLDLAGSYNLGNWTFTLGVDNASNSYPDKVIAANNNDGTIPYSEFSPDGFNGRYYYTKVIYHW
ncbi:TonB-dependent receptor plug domain-containing protein [Dyella flava]|uniref:TonB-dependent receptor n=1 Tax=Dyella flava TaxID=1920170 RepID=A0ABS2K7Y8_9GAMM|nr:TonB-dependent receptor [Dyella flava]MBM7126820.1 TonB-dependent receptor [Dyella flava]GLQ50420.1 ligand-gated channel [Dyella flava]